LTLSLILRIVRIGAAAALVVGLAGWALERSRFGVSDEAALRRVEDELRERFDTSAAALGAMAARVAAEPELFRGTPRDPGDVRRLFDAVSAALPAEAGTPGSPFSTSLVSRSRGRAASPIFRRSACWARQPC